MNLQPKKKKKERKQAQENEMRSETCTQDAFGLCTDVEMKNYHTD